MGKIQCLDAHVADLIAAGEVVERPASVVKELVENAIDAGASSVTVEIRRGGMSYIRVTDNGCGIAPEDAETAFLRHATSKIRGAQDLDRIGTLGFRGEALAAISAVSKIELTTRRAEDELGTALLMDGGTLRTRQEVGCPAGTTMIVRDLFYNTPARLKFMKRDVAEGAAVFATVQHIAMSHPEIAFCFSRDGRQDLTTSGDGQKQSAVYAVLGREMALALLPMSGGDNGLQVEGFVCRPSCCRGTRGYQHFFVNGRYVRSKTMMAALEEAYQNTKMVGKFPACVLYLTSELNAVDVNVHPAKTEVKFTDEKALFTTVFIAVKNALAQEKGHPQVQLAPKAVENPLKKEDFFQSMTAQELRASHDKTAKATSGDNGEGLALRDGGYALRAQMAAQVAPPVHVIPKRYQVAVQPEKEFLGVELPIVTERPARGAAFFAAAQDKQKTPAFERKPIAETSATATEKAERKSAKPAQVEHTPKAERPVEHLPFVRGDAEPMVQEVIHTPEQTEPVASEQPAWRMAGELFNTYIVVEQGERVFYIDKHAAHERMNFDRLKAQDYQPMKQLLLTPIVLTPPPEEGAALLSHLPLLEQFGFEVEDFGKGSVIVRQVPDYLSTGEVESTLSELAHKLLVSGTADPSAARDEVLHTMACKGAIKGGWKNDAEELKVVVDAVMSGAVKYCPHGRPVAIEMTKKQLEKQFKRI